MLVTVVALYNVAGLPLVPPLGKEVALMVKRIVLLVTVALVMAAMMAVLSTGAVAQPNPNANACAAAAVDPQEFEPNLGLVTSEFIAEEGAQVFRAIILEESTGCRQNV